jgi:hypothetical protein
MKYLIVITAIIVPLSGQYLITDPDSLLNSGADYFIVTHANFTNELYPLCQLRDSLGLLVKMVEVDLIYSTFPDPNETQSIRDCMDRIYNFWSPRPTYILLVGDAERGGGSNDFIPSPLFPKFDYYYWGGITQHAADNWYVTLEGNDSIPDMIIARIPVNTAQMTQDVVNKIITYETSDTTGIWQRTVLVNSSRDRESHAEGYVDDYLTPAGDSVIKIYERQGNNPSLRQRHIDAINQGVFLILPVCHGTQPPAWCGPWYTLFRYTDIPSLTNQVLPLSFGRG